MPTGSGHWISSIWGTGPLSWVLQCTEEVEGQEKRLLIDSNPILVPTVTDILTPWAGTIPGHEGFQFTDPMREAVYGSARQILKTLSAAGMIPEDNHGMKRWNFCGTCSVKGSPVKSPGRSQRCGLTWLRYGVLLMNSKSSSAR